MKTKMYYFTHEEAKAIKHENSHFIGENMVCAENGDKSKLSAITIQPSNEMIIDSQNRVVMGYYVNFVFGLAPRLFPIEFSSWNDLQPITAKNVSIS